MSPAPGGRFGAVNRRGAFAVVCAMAAFAINDTFMKLATGRLPVGEVILLRSGLAALLLLVLIRGTGDWKPSTLRNNRPLYVRALFEVLVIVAYITALKYLPLGETTAVIQTVPIFMTAWAALVWKEHVGARGWLAVLGGFAGILLVMQPTVQGVGGAMGLAVAAAIFATGRDLSTRRISRDTPSMMIALVSIVASAAAGLVPGGLEDWRAPDAYEVLLLGGAAIAVTGANYAIILAYRSADVAVVSPFRYTAVPFALLSGVIVWGHTPDPLSSAGIAIIVAAGLLALGGTRRKATPAA